MVARGVIWAVMAWGALGSSAQAQDQASSWGAMRYTHGESIAQGVHRSGSDTLASPQTLEQLGWQVRVVEDEADLMAEGRRIRVPVKPGPDQKPWVVLGPALDQLGAIGEWDDAEKVFSVFGVVRQIEVFAGRLRVDSTLGVRPVVFQVSNPNRWIVDLQGAKLRPNAKFPLPPGVRFGQFRPDTVRVVLENPDLKGLKGEVPATIRSMTLSLDGWIPEDKSSLTAAIVNPPRPQVGPVTIVPLDPAQQPPPPDPASGLGSEPTPVAPRAISPPADSSVPIVRVSSPVLSASTSTGATVTLATSGQVSARPAGSYRDPLTIDVLLFGVLSPDPIQGLGASEHLEKAEFVPDQGGLRLTLKLKRPMGFELASTNRQITVQLVLPKIANGKLAGKVIVVDAGHGGSDPGAVSRDRKVQEKTLALAVARQLSKQLTEEGAAVIMTRTDDTRLALSERSAVANRSRADLFISVHFNSNRLANSASGTKIFFHKQDPLGRLLAKCISAEVAKVSQLPNLGIWSDTRIYDSGFAVLRNSRMTAVLLELGFINNDRDVRRMTQPDFHADSAAAVVRALKVYVGDASTKTSPPNP